MKQKNQRALNAFAAMESLPDDLILDAERALTEAENGFSLTPTRRENPFVRFLNSGWGVAAIAGLVSVVVLVILIRAGKEPAPYQPPVKPAGSTIEMSSEGADYTLSMEQGSYDEGADRITVIITGKTPGEAISMRNGWHLERLTEEGAEIVYIYYTEEAIEAVRPDKDGYATIKKTIHIDRTPLTAGTYRLHATRHDGEKYVSVAYCTFTVGDPGSLTWDSDTLAPTEPETDPSAEYSPAIDRPYTISVTDTITMGGTPVLGPKRLDVTIKAVEPGVALMLSTNYRIVKLAGSPNGKNAGWLALALETEVYPTEENQGYAVHQDAITFSYPGEWLPGLYRLYALNHDEEYIDYCDFVITGDHSMSMELFLKETRYTTQSTMLEIQILGHQRGEPASWYEGWSLYAVQGESRTLMGACSPIEIAYEAPAPDENAFSLIDIDQSIRHVTGGKYTTLPAGDYELVFGSGNHTQVMPFTVVGDADAALTPNDSSQIVERGVFFWANGSPFIRASLKTPNAHTHVTNICYNKGNQAKEQKRWETEGYLMKIFDLQS